MLWMLPSLFQFFPLENPAEKVDQITDEKGHLCSVYVNGLIVLNIYAAYSTKVSFGMKYSISMYKKRYHDVSLSHFHHSTIRCKYG